MKFPPLVRIIIWAALCIAMVCYLIVIQMTSPEANGENVASLKMPLYILGLLSFAAGQGIRYLVNHTKDKSGKPKVPDWIDTAFIIALALTESAAVFGLVLGIMGAPLADYLPLFVISAVGMLLLFPTAFFRVEQNSGN